MESEQRPRPFSRASSIWGWVVAALLLLHGLWSLPLSLFGPERARIPGDMTGSRLNNYMLEHFHRWFRGQEAGCWDAPFMYPGRNTSVLTDDPLGTAPLYSAFRHSGFNRESAYQLWMLSMFALNYVCCFLVMRAWTGRTLIAASVAYVFAFGIYNIGALEHAQVMPKFMVPVALWLTWKALASHRPRSVFLAALATTFQLYCSLSIGLALAWMLLFLWLAHALLHRADRHATARTGRKAWLVAGAASLLAATALFPLMNACLHAPCATPLPYVDDPASGLPHPLWYFTSHPAALSWQDLSRHLHRGPGVPFFMGALPWLAIAALPIVFLTKRFTPKQRRPIMVVASTLASGVLFFLDIPGFSPFRTLLHVAGLSASHTMAGILHLQAFFVVLLLALMLSLIRTGPLLGAMMNVLLPAAILIDNHVDPNGIVSYDKYASRTEVDGISRSITQQLSDSCAAIIYDPVTPVAHAVRVENNASRTRLSAMLAAQHVGIPLVQTWALNCTSGGTDQKHHRLPAPPRQVCTIDNLEGFKRTSIDTIMVRVADGRWLVTDTSAQGTARLSRAVPGAQDAFIRIRMADGRFALLAPNGRFVCAELTQQQQISASAVHLGDPGIFQPMSPDSGGVAWMVSNGRFISLSDDDRTLSVSADSTAVPQRFTSIVRHLRGSR